MSKPKYQITAYPSGQNRRHVIDAAVEALTSARISPDEVNKYVDEAMSAQYENVLEVTRQWVYTAPTEETDMAQAKVKHSGQATVVTLKGNKNKPEPALTVIVFPGGSVEVSRTSDGDYWAHIGVNKEADPVTVIGDVVDGRIDYEHDAYTRLGIADIPEHKQIQHIAIRIKRK